MADNAADRTIEAVARHQHGAFSRAQALDAGATRRMVQQRRDSGAWLTIERGVYALNGAPFTWLRQAKAAELSVPGSAVSHGAAAHLHGLDGYPAARLDLTAGSGRAGSRLATVHHLDDPAVTRRQQLAVTSLPLTLIQLAGVQSPGRLGATVDDVLVGGLATLDQIQAEVDRRSAGHPNGMGTLVRILADRGDGYIPPTNVLEACPYRLLADPRLPPSRRQAALPWWPDAPGRVDALIPAWHRIVEADGRRWHTRRRDFERDRWRDHQAQRHGYEVTRFTHAQLSRSPDYALDVLLSIGRVHGATCRAA